MTMRKVAIVAAHFTPSNLASVHRARLWAQHLPEFRWQPIIVTTHWRYYEEAADWDLHRIVPSDLRVVRTRALPAKPVRLVGDVGVRAWPWHYRALCRLAREESLDFVHITVPSHYSALLGRAVHRATGVPYGIDYIDPWVHRWPGVERAFSRHWFSHKLSRRLEPWAVRGAAAITGVAPGYFSEVLERNPGLADTAVTGAMPYGISEVDFEAAARLGGGTGMRFSRDDGAFNLFYAGALLPGAHGVLEKLFAAVRLLAQRAPGNRLRLHFAGTAQPLPGELSVATYASRAGLTDRVFEYPDRMPYLTVLRHLREASAILILGSDRPHYSPSKVYQAIMAQRPLLAMLQADSAAVPVLESCRAGAPVCFHTPADLDPGALADRLQGMIDEDEEVIPQICWDAFARYTARASARALATVLDAAVVRAAAHGEQQSRGVTGP